ncbi:NAD(P)-binding protein [Trichoderma citrinoviride]|uniref:NAD(P)-binding protein n=1 Tax=Trichoderma citrinoviride TaxID=58853 RepID=A0A2T4BFR9_9HYPO|nr:NAD(P)-binding protein [Trichoderma citrinoviride]PTB68098.1 NAD(P)-binding protein [Trichoderma citrinoviride]
MPPVWFITAASSGFGRAIALAALRRGHTVVATARNPSRLADLAAAGAHTLAFDVTSPLPAVRDLAAAVFAQHGRVDYLVNAAGYILEGAIEEASPEEVLASFDTNVFGAMRTIQAFLPHMRAQPVSAENGVRGAVATFGSLGSWRGAPSGGVYGMTKWACSALAETLAAELAPFQIKATVVEPGYFRTGFLNPSARVSTKARIEAYEDESTPTGMSRRRLAVTDGRQLGDVDKGAEVIVDALTGTGVASGKALPVRVVLGSDAEGVIRNKMAETGRILDEWSEVIRSTDAPLPN